MGMCLKTAKKQDGDEEITTPILPDIEFQSYSSNFDHFYSLIESKEYNFLKYLQLSDFVILLSDFKIDHKLDPNIKMIDELLDRNEYAVFLEKKVLNNYLITKFLYKDEQKASLFKDFHLKTFDYFLKGLVSYYKNVNKEAAAKVKGTKTLKKLYLICIGMLNCTSTNRNKILFFFNLFSNDEEMFQRTRKLEDFVYFLFIYPSTASIINLHELANNYQEVRKINDDDYVKILETFEVKDILKARTKFLDDFFADRTSLSFAEFEQKFGRNSNQNFDWIFSRRGIRSFLEKLNHIE